MLWAQLALRYSRLLFGNSEVYAYSDKYRYVKHASARTIDDMTKTKQVL